MKGLSWKFHIQTIKNWLNKLIPIAIQKIWIKIQFCSPSWKITHMLFSCWICSTSGKTYCFNMSKWTFPVIVCSTKMNGPITQSCIKPHHIFNFYETQRYSTTAFGEWDIRSYSCDDLHSQSCEMLLHQWTF